MNQRRNAAISMGMLAAALAVAALTHATPRAASVLGLPGPHCALRALGGEGACPGCGLMRSTALAVHGEVRAAWSVHPAGLVVAALCLAGILVHLHVLVRGRRAALHRRLLRAGRWVFLGSVLVGWMIR